MKAEAPAQTDLSGSLFDAVESAPPAEEKKPAPAAKEEEPARREEEKPAPVPREAEPVKADEPAPAQADLSGSLFDIVESAPVAEKKAELLRTPEPDGADEERADEDRACRRG